MKVSILTDLEGPSGVNGRSDGIGNTIINSDISMQALVNEVNAVCEGLVAAGCDEIVVLDGHGASNSIDIFKLHPQAQLLQIGDWSPVLFLDGSYDALIQLGAHTMQSGGGFMSHSYNSHAVAEMRLNGEAVGEIGMSSYIASYFGVPTIMVSGDDRACHEARALLGDNLEVVPTKATVNRYTAVNYPVEDVYRNLQAAAERAVKNIGKYTPLAMEESYELVIRFMCPNQTLDYIRMGIEQIDEVTMRFRSDDFIDLWAQRQGWAPGVHNKYFNVNANWLHPHTLAADIFKD